MNVALLNALNLNPKPGPPTRMYKGAACVFPFFSGKGVFFGRLSWEDIPEKNWEKGGGGGFKPISRDMGCFSAVSREIKKKGV